MSTQNTPGVYKKDGLTRLARSASTAVALVFEGFKRTGDLPGSVDESSASTSAQPESATPGESAPTPTPASIFGRQADVPTNPEV